MLFWDRTLLCRFCYDDDLYVISSAYHSSRGPSPAAVHQRPYHDVPINSLKHRLLTHLYRRAVADATAAETVVPILVFFRRFDEFRLLRMWKMQLLDENHLLIRYGWHRLICVIKSSHSSIYLGLFFFHSSFRAFGYLIVYFSTYQFTHVFVLSDHLGFGVGL